MYLEVAEQLLMMVGLGVFIVSLILYVMRTQDIKSVLVFWQATISFTKRGVYDQPKRFNDDVIGCYFAFL